MGIVFTILTVFVILASVLLTIVVLLQNSKGGGLASNFAVGNQTFGVRKTADILEKVTWGLVAFIFVASIVTTFATGGSGRSEIDVSQFLYSRLIRHRRPRQRKQNRTICCLCRIQGSDIVPAGIMTKCQFRTSGI